MKTTGLQLLFILLFLTGLTFGQNNDSLQSNRSNDTIPGEPDWIYQDDPFVEGLDNDYQFFFQSNLCWFDSEDSVLFNLPKDSIPPWTPEELSSRLLKLDSLTVLDLKFNKATHRMLSFYLRKRRAMLSRVLGLTKLYYPLFEAELAKKDMPLELKHLAVVESALTNVIKSRVGATGLWQFMYNTGRYLGMQIDTYVDDRCDPVASTKKAVEYLEYLHGLYDDWYMALAAYNAGPGNVNKAIRRSGNKRTYWEIYKYLPRETRGYVPAFIAVNYLMNHYVDHNIRPIPSKYVYTEIDTVNVKKPVSFNQISEVLCIPVSELQFLNPQYKLDFIPTSTNQKQKYGLALPYYLIGEFLVNEESIYNYNLFDGNDSALKDTVEVDKVIRHKVRSGESLGGIANKYEVTIKQIKKWNKMKSTTIFPSQRLKIHVVEQVVIDRRAFAKEEKKEPFDYYTIKRGDSLSGIANNHKGVTVKSLMKLNGFKKKSSLIPGKVIKLRKN